MSGGKEARLYAVVEVAPLAVSKGDTLGWIDYLAEMRSRCIRKRDREGVLHFGRMMADLVLKLERRVPRGMGESR